MARRRTQIVATLGPATRTPESIEAILKAGADVVRLNFAHGTREEQAELARTVREVSAQLGKDVGLLGDLQGPKIRIECFRDGHVELVEGQTFTIDAGMDADAGDEHAVGTAYKQLPEDLKPGDVLVLGDGRISIEVERIDGQKVMSRVLHGGLLSDHKGINRAGGGLSAAALTDKDLEDIKVAAELEVDYLAISFVRDAMDIHRARELLQSAGGHAGVIAKIERSEAVGNFDEICEVSDAVMVARGDLAVEIGDADLPAVQKHIIHRAREKNTVVITATQMMESMISSPVPTRAEIMDVANAMMDGTDAVMLSAETAIGRYPVKTVEAMARICLGAEKNPRTQRSRHRMDEMFTRIDEAMAMATMYTANHLPVKAIVALTESGATALWMSRIRSGIPIYSFTRHVATRRRVTLYRGVYPIAFDVTTPSDPALVLDEAGQKLLDENLIARGDWVIFTKGDFRGVSGGTNTMKVVRVGVDASGVID